MPLFRIDSTGPTQRTKHCTSPIEIFQLLFTTAIVGGIVQQTMLFAQQSRKEFSFCAEQLLAFIGLNVAMGLIRLPQIQDYWNKNEILATPFFPSIMSRDHFQNILGYLHLNDSSQQKKHGEDGYDPLYKVRPLLDHFSAVFPFYYQPAQHISIDEMMTGTRCRIAFLQYMPKKPTRFGIKVWVLAEAKTGYVLDFQVYTGATKDESSKGLAYRVVNDLIQKYQGKNHLLYVDNFYTSPELLVDLLKKRVYCTGTIYERIIEVFLQALFLVTSQHRLDLTGLLHVPLTN